MGCSVGSGVSVGLGVGLEVVTVTVHHVSVFSVTMAAMLILIFVGVTAVIVAPSGIPDPVTVEPAVMVSVLMIPLTSEEEASSVQIKVVVVPLRT